MLDPKAASPPADPSPVLLCETVFLITDMRGRLRGGVSTPRRRESATTALSDEDKGDTSGPGIIREIDLLVRVDGLSLVDVGRCCCV